MLSNYDFANIKEPDRRRIAIEAFRLELCDVLYYLRRARFSSFGSHSMNWMLAGDYGLDKVLNKYGDGPMHDIYEEIGVIEKVVMDILLCTADYGDKEDGRERPPVNWLDNIPAYNPKSLHRAWEVWPFLREKALKDPASTFFNFSTKPFKYPIANVKDTLERPTFRFCRGNLFTPVEEEDKRD